MSLETTVESTPSNVARSSAETYTSGEFTLLLEKLRCLECRDGHLTRQADEVQCSTCRKRYPLKQQRFPDFLNEPDRRALERELEFWKTHFSNVDYKDESTRSYDQWAALMNVKATDDVLEVGCGSGAMVRHLNIRLRVGIDPAECLLTNSKNFFPVIGVATDLPFRDNSFDVVFFKGALHHIENKEKGFREAIRVTKPGGKIIIIEPNAAHPQRRLISNPDSMFRKVKLFKTMIGPVESFQTADELRVEAKANGVVFDKLVYANSLYDHLSVWQALQKVYSLLKWVVPVKYIMPTYFISFTKPRTPSV
jgi:SAM-dependent methyltransferase